MSNANSDNTCKIVLAKNSEFAIVDLDDEFLVSKFQWSFHKGRKTNYARAYLGDGAYIYMHHLITGGTPPNGYVVDHINGNGLDNRKENLRVLSNGENIRRGFDMYAGVYFVKRLKKRPWRAEATIDNEKFHVGYFATQAEAIAARRTLLIEKGVKGLDK